MQQIVAALHSPSTDGRPFRRPLERGDAVNDRVYTRVRQEFPRWLNPAARRRSPAGALADLWPLNSASFAAPEGCEKARHGVVKATALAQGWRILRCETRCRVRRVRWPPTGRRSPR